MRKLAFALLVLVASLCVWWFASGSQDGEAASAHETFATPPTRVQSTEFAREAEKTTETSDGSLRETVKADEVAAAPIEEPAPTCAVFGTVVDSSGSPIANVQITLSAYQRWSEDFEGPVAGDDERFRGWRVVTGADGRFRFDTPPPDAQSVQALQVMPDPYHDLHVIRFGREGRPPLIPGDHDLGELRLADTGAIAGIVTDRAGRPLHEARARIANERSSTLQREATTDATGRYLIGHIKPGTYGVNCEHEGHLSEFRTPFEVVAGRTTEGVDFALGDSPFLSGRVVDVDGAPIADAHVWGWPQSSGKGAGATTAADGSFTIWLPQDEPYRLEAKFNRRDDTPAFEDRDTHHEPNSRDIVIVLPRTVLVTIAVVDDASGAPIERFGLRVERPRESNGFRTMAPPQPTPRPGGTAQARVQPGIDRYHVVATGFQDAEGVFDASVADSERFEIRMGRGAGITGRALEDGLPAESVTVLLEAGNLMTPRGGSEKAFTPDTYIAAQTMRTGADGRFRFDGVKLKTHRLTLRAASGASHVQLLDARFEQATDLGDLELQATGAIEGVVLTPPGRSRAGLVVRLGDWRSGVAQTTDSQGSFRFDGVAAGKSTLFVDELSGRVASGAPFPVEVAPGEVARVELDLRDRGTCEVTLTVLFGGERIPGAHIRLHPLAEETREHSLGRLDEDSRISSWAPALGPAAIAMYTPEGETWRHPTARLDLTLDARIDQVIEFELASLAIVLPDSFTPPERGYVRVSLLGDGQSRGHTVSEELSTTAPNRRRIVFARVPAGACRARVEVFDKDQKPLRVQTAPNTWSMRTEPMLEHSEQVTLVAGREYELRIP